MDRLLHKYTAKSLRKKRIRARVMGTTEVPRLSVYISNRHVSAQIIDDSTHRTLAAVTTVGQKMEPSKMKQAEWVGTQIAHHAKKAGIKKIVFDRNGKLYHGRVKALADEARRGGLEF